MLPEFCFDVIKLQFDDAANELGDSMKIAESGVSMDDQPNEVDDSINDSSSVDTDDVNNDENNESVTVDTSKDLAVIDKNNKVLDEEMKQRLKVCSHEAAHALVSINLGGDLVRINVTPTDSYLGKGKLAGLTVFSTDGMGKVNGPLKRKPGTIKDWNWAMAMSSLAGDAYAYWRSEDCSARNLGSHLDHLFADTIDGNNAIRYLMDTKDKVSIDDFLSVYGEDGWWILLDVYRDALDMVVRYSSELKILTAYLNTYAGEDGEANATGFVALNTAITAGNIALGSIAGAAGIVGAVAGGAIKVAGGIGSIIGHFVK